MYFGNLIILLQVNDVVRLLINTLNEKSLRAAKIGLISGYAMLQLSHLKNRLIVLQKRIARGRVQWKASFLVQSQRKKLKVIKVEIRLSCLLVKKL